MVTKRKIWFVAGMALFAAYFFIAARPIPLETVLVPCWLNSIESDAPSALPSALPVSLDGGPVRDSGGLPAERRIPFNLSGRFGYISRDGFFSVNQVKKANVSLSPERWAEYEAEPDRITVYDSSGETLTLIEYPRGYPFFLDERTFLIGSEQNVISEVGRSGAVSWTYEFPAPLTCVDAAAGLVLAGSLDGVIGLVDSRGRQVFTFEPGGSRYAVILGCAMSRDGSRLALVSGIDDQRFLVLERYGANSFDYKVVYHEFLDDGFRRPVYITFVENDRWVVFERGGGLGFYEISTRQAGKVALNGAISAVDQSGGQGMVFVIISRFGDAKELICIRLPDRVIVESPFRSEGVFLGRIDSRLIIGGGQTLVSFDLEKR